MSKNPNLQGGVSLHVRITKVPQLDAYTVEHDGVIAAVCDRIQAECILSESSFAVLEESGQVKRFVTIQEAGE